MSGFVFSGWHIGFFLFLMYCAASQKTTIFCCHLLLSLALGFLAGILISMFYGIIIRMYYAPKEHPPPHFHVYYAEYKATVDIRSCELLEGNLPKKQLKLVLAWAELHQDELMADWELVMNSEEPYKIQPLQ